MCWIHSAILVFLIYFYALTYTNAKFNLKPIDTNLRLKMLSLFNTESKSHSKETKTTGTRTCESCKSKEDETLSIKDEPSKNLEVFNKIPRQETDMTNYNLTDTADPKEVFLVTNDSQIDFINHNSDIFYGMIVSSDPGITDIEESPPELDHFQSASRHRSEHCHPGKLYRLDCNACQCNHKGRLLCTQWKCPEKYGIDDQEEPHCVDGQNYKKDCNTCFCDHGEFICTKKACGQLQPVNWNYKECIPGKFYQNKCNRCSCASDFKLKCTNYKCNKYNQVKHCDVGNTTKLDCNNCTCNENGHIMCTKMICSHVIYPDMVCYPGGVFKRGCKVCKCNNFGTGGVCTNKLCYSSHVFVNSADSGHTHHRRTLPI